MAARIPDWEAELDRGVQEVIDAAGYKDTGEKLIGAVSSLFNFVPKLYSSLKNWAKAVQDSEKIVYEALGTVHNQVSSHSKDIADIQKVMELADENLTKEIEGIKQAVEKSDSTLRSDIESIKKVVDRGDENITQHIG